MVNSKCMYILRCMYVCMYACIILGLEGRSYEGKGLYVCMYVSMYVFR